MAHARLRSLVILLILGACGGGGASELERYTTRAIQSPSPGEGFAQAVSLGGGVVAVASPRDLRGTGSVHFFDQESGFHRARLSSPLPRASGRFGCVLDGDATRLLVGADGERRAYLFDRATRERRATFESLEAGFGRLVALDGDHVWVASDRSVQRFDATGGAATYRLEIAGATDLAADDGRALVGQASAARLVDGDDVVVLPRPARVVALEGTRAATAGGGCVYGFDVTTGAERFEACGPASYGVRIAFAGPHLLVAWTNERGQGLVDMLGWDGGARENTLTPAASASALAVDGGIALIGVAQRSLAQTVNCTTGEFLVQYASPNATKGGHFGQSVGLIGQLLAIGAPGEGSGDGRVHLLNEDGSLARTLQPPAAGEFGNFGQVLLPFGSLLAVSAPRAGTNADGRVYLIEPSDGTIVRTLQSPQAFTDGEFGAALSGAGEVTLVIGAPGEGAISSPPGVVHLYNSSGDSFTARVPNPDDQLNARFGHALAGLPNGNVLVGAPGAQDVQGAPTGKAYLIDPFATGFLSAEYESPNPEPDGRFGHSVAADGQYFYIGAPREDVNQDVDAGRVYQFLRETDELENTILSPDQEAGGFFGESLSRSGSRLAVGAPGEPADPASGLLPPLPQQPPAEGLVHVFDLDTLFRDQRYENQQPTPEAGRFGQSVFLLPGMLLVGAPSEGEEEGRAYKFDLALRQALESPNVQDLGTFGFACAKYDDNRLLFTALAENQGAGRVYLYNANTGIYELTIDNPSQGQGSFGTSVTAWNGTIAVGVPDADNGVGQVLLFDAQGNPLTPISNPDRAGQQFGESLAVDGNGNLVVGAPGDVDFSGAVHVFDSAGALVRTIPAVANMEAGEFGTKVFAIGDAIAVQAPLEAQSAGRVHVFGNDGTFLYSLDNPVSNTDSLFGQAVILYNDQLYVGEPGSEQTIGNVHIFDPEDGSFDRTIESPLGFATATFGFSFAQVNDALAVGCPFAGGGRVAIIDGSDEVLDLLFTGNPKTNGSYGWCVVELQGRVVATAPFEDVNPTTAGRAYITATSAQGGGQQPPPDDEGVFESPTPTESGGFGQTVTFSATNAVIGAPNEGNDAGVVHVLSSATGALQQTIPSPNATAGGAFGAAVAGNSLMLVVGAPQELVEIEATEPTNQTVPIRAGRAYLYQPGDAIPQLSFVSLNPEADGNFGFSVAVADLNLAVGAPGETVETAAQAGRAYYFDCATDVVLQVFEAPQAAVGDEFGFAVAARGFEVFVGAPGANDGQGIVYRFDGLSGALLDTYTSPDAQDGGRFGAALAVDGNRLVVGAPNEIDVNQDQFARGRVHLFEIGSGDFEQTLQSEDDPDGGLFGSSVAIASGTVWVGAPGESAGEGRSYEFDAVSGTQRDTYSSPNGEDDGGFGAVVAATGANVLIGAPAEDGGAVDSGRAYLNPDPDS